MYSSFQEMKYDWYVNENNLFIHVIYSLVYIVIYIYIFKKQTKWFDFEAFFPDKYEIGLYIYK